RTRPRPPAQTPPAPTRPSWCLRRRAVLPDARKPHAPGPDAVLTDALGDPDPAVRGHAALALGGRGVTAAVPVLVGMVVAGVHDVEAAEVLGTLSRDPGCGARVLTALTGELAAPGADSAARLRLTQALVELPGAAAHDVLRELAHDDDRAVALVAAAFAAVLDARSPGGRQDEPLREEPPRGRPGAER
ncbi:HEAT repeat domain-containing protein, partial [Streptomyces sp. NPDC004011]